MSLSEIENAYLRPNFIEPRIHFAINCASVGCPKLRRSAYTGIDIEQQLADATKAVHHEGSRWFRFDNQSNTAHVTEIYRESWYGDDFVQVAGSVLKYIAEHSQSVKTAIDAGKQPSIEFIKYDWSLNAQSRKP